MKDLIERQAAINVVEINDNTTEWLGNHTPFRCKRCGHYSDTRTPYCAYCGKEAVSSANS